MRFVFISLSKMKKCGYGNPDLLILEPDHFRERIKVAVNLNRAAFQHNRDRPAAPIGFCNPMADRNRLIVHTAFVHMDHATVLIDFNVAKVEKFFRKHTI